MKELERELHRKDKALAERLPGLFSQKRMARPVRKDDFTGRGGLHQRIRPQPYPWPRWMRRLRPDKVHGVEHHIFNQAAETPARPLRHLSFTSTDLVCVSGAVPGRYLVISSLHELGVQRHDRDAIPPNDPCQLGGERDHHHVGVSPGEQLAYPCADPRGCLGKMHQSGACGMDQLGS